ncbi:MAG: hypothetical protein ACLSUW_05880 [Akkermansia sp.]
MPLGGDHISNDITLMTGIPLAQAELLKKTEGTPTAFPGKPTRWCACAERAYEGCRH